MDPIALVASAVWATMVCTLLFLLPGATLGPVVLPGASTPLARLGRAAGVSLLATLLLCTTLARLGVLTTPVLLGSLVALTALGLVLHRPSLSRPRRHRRAWWLGAVAGLALAGALVVLPSAAGSFPDLLPKSSTTWYYANLAQEVAGQGALPRELPEWGASRPFQTDYLPVTAHTAAALVLLPGDLLVDLELYRLIVLVLGLLFATLLFRRWVSGWAALLGAILLFDTVRLDQKFDGYRPETVALVLALFTLWVADRAFVERRRGAFAVALVGSVLVFLSHAEVFLILAPALVGLGFARLVVAPGGNRSRLGLRGRWRARDLAAPVMAVALIVGGIVARRRRRMGADRRESHPRLRRRRWACARGRSWRAPRPAGRDPGRLDLHGRPDMGLLHGLGGAGARRRPAAGRLHRHAPAATLDRPGLARARRPAAIRARGPRPAGGRAAAGMAVPRCAPPPVRARLGDLRRSAGRRLRSCSTRYRTRTCRSERPAGG